ISVNPTPLADLTNGSVSLTFTSRNWFIPQVVRVTALPDAVREGTMFVPIQFSSTEGDDAGAKVTIATTREGTSTLSEIQRLTTNAYRGTFTITVGTQTTNLIDFNATTAQ